MRIGRIGKAAWDIGKCLGIALLVSLLAELVFALLLKCFAFPTGVISPVNQVIKVIAIFLGCVLGFSPERGILKGAIGGVLVIAATWLVFSFLAGGVTIGKLFPVELLFGGVVGAISGIIAVNLRK